MGAVTHMNAEIGTELPRITKTPNEVALFVFSAATWNPHRVHYDRDYAHAEGHKDILVQGSLQANWLVEALMSWAPGAVLTSFSFRNVSPAFVNQSFNVSGRVIDVRGQSVTVELQAEGPSGVTTVGRGTLQLPGANPRQPSGSGKP